MQNEQETVTRLLYKILKQTIYEGRAIYFVQGDLTLHVSLKITYNFVRQYRYSLSGIFVKNK